MRKALLAVAFLLVTGTIAVAGTITVSITPQSNAPITLTGCTFQKQFVPLARGVSVEGFRTGVVFTNNASRPISTVVFLFTMHDTAGAVIDSHTLKSSGSYAPAVPIDNIHWLVVDSWPTLGAMDCSIDHVVFTDGTAWSAEAQ
jgi:hypothetical protein